MSTTNPLIIYHANCIDGFTAAWAAWKKFGDSASYEPHNYGQAITSDKFKDRSVYIVDFSFPRNLLTAICSVAKSVTILDHHKTAQEDLTDWAEKPANCYIVFDMNRSGAGITWDYFFPEEQRPKLVNAVEDRDLWKFKLPDTKNIHAFLAIQDKTFQYWELVHRSLGSTVGYETVVNQGIVLIRQFSKFCDEISETAREVDIFINGEKLTGLAANCSGQFASEVGNILAKRSATFGATYFSDQTGAVKWSLRSEGLYDVSRIAKHFGGGGHRNAAGFTLKDHGRDTEAKIRLWSYSGEST